MVTIKHVSSIVTANFPRPFGKLTVLKTSFLATTILTCSIAMTSIVPFQSYASEPTAKPELLFEEGFTRDEKQDAKEMVCNDWTTNSAGRAKGHKQADLNDGYLTITTHPEADHAAVVKHEAGFQNGKISVRFRLHDAKGISFNTGDPAASELSHAGHLTQVKVKPGEVLLEDGKDGIFSMDIYEEKKAGTLPKEKLAAHMKGKTAKSTADIKLNQWHELIITFQGNKMSANIDGQPAGSLTSTGCGYPMKANFAISVPGSADVDDVKIWSLSQ